MFVTSIDQVIKTKNFDDAITPKFNKEKLSLDLPVSDANFLNIKVNLNHLKDLFS